MSGSNLEYHEVRGTIIIGEMRNPREREGEANGTTKEGALKQSAYDGLL